MGSLFGGFVCAAAKTVSGSPYDHIGVVVRDGNSRNVIVEASFSGVTVRELCERVKRSSASQICVRELRVQRTEEIRGEARAFVGEVQHLSYREGGMGLFQMASAALRLDRGKERRRRMHAEMIRLSDLIERLERQREDGSVTEAKSANGANGIATAVARRDELVGRLGFSSPADRSAGGPGTASSPASQGMFCSELVAALYQRLGLLDSFFPSCEDYVPADFAPGSPPAPSTLSRTEDRPRTAGGHRVVLLQGAELSPGRWIRRRDSRRARSPPVPDAPAETTPRPPSAPRGANPGTGIVAELVAVATGGYPVTPDSGGHAAAATWGERVARDCGDADGGPGMRAKGHEGFYASMSGSGETVRSIIRGVSNSGGEGGALVDGGIAEQQADAVGAVGDVDTSQQLLAAWKLHRHVRHGDSDPLHCLRCLACVCSEKLAAAPSLLRMEFPSRSTILPASFGDQDLLVPAMRGLPAVEAPTVAEVEGDHARSWYCAVPPAILMPLAVAAASTLATRSVIPRLARTRPSQTAAPWVISGVLGAAVAAGVATAAAARDAADRCWRYD